MRRQPSVDFVGSGVTASNVGHAVTITIPGALASGATSGEEFTSPGSHTFNVPANVEWVWVDATGGGGGGGPSVCFARAAAIVFNYSGNNCTTGIPGMGGSGGTNPGGASGGTGSNGIAGPNVQIN